MNATAEALDWRQLQLGAAVLDSTKGERTLVLLYPTRGRRRWWGNRSLRFAGEIVFKPGSGQGAGRIGAEEITIEAKVGRVVIGKNEYRLREEPKGVLLVSRLGGEGIKLASAPPNAFNRVTHMRVADAAGREFRLPISARGGLVDFLLSLVALFSLGFLWFARRRPLMPAAFQADGAMAKAIAAGLMYTQLVRSPQDYEDWT